MVEKMCKKAVVDSLEVPSRYLPGGKEENHESLRQNSPSLDQDLNSGPLEYEVVLATLP